MGLFNLFNKNKLNEEKLTGAIYAAAQEGLETHPFSDLSFEGSFELLILNCSVCFPYIRTKFPKMNIKHIHFGLIMLLDDVVKNNELKHEFSKTHEYYVERSAIFENEATEVLLEQSRANTDNYFNPIYSYAILFKDYGRKDIDITDDLYSEELAYFGTDFRKHIFNVTDLLFKYIEIQKKI